LQEAKNVFLDSLSRPCARIARFTDFHHPPLHLSPLLCCRDSWGFFWNSVNSLFSVSPLAPFWKGSHGFRSAREYVLSTALFLSFLPFPSCRLSERTGREPDAFPFRLQFSRTSLARPQIFPVSPSLTHRPYFVGDSSLITPCQSKRSLTLSRLQGRKIGPLLGPRPAPLCWRLFPSSCTCANLFPKVKVATPFFPRKDGPRQTQCASGSLAFTPAFAVLYMRVNPRTGFSPHSVRVDGCAHLPSPRTSHSLVSSPYTQ